MGGRCGLESSTSPLSIPPDRSILSGPHLERSLSRAAGAALAGKLLVLFAFGAFCGYWYHQDVTARLGQASVLPVEPDGGAFDPTNLVQEAWPLWGHITLVVVMVGVFFGIYELLGWMAGRALFWLLSLGFGGGREHDA